MRRLMRALWAGEVPLAQAFWSYAIALGFVVNLTTTLLAFGLMTTESPGYIALLVFILAIPYNVFMLVAVWRSADRYEGPRIWADLARAMIILWTIGASAL